MSVAPQSYLQKKVLTYTCMSVCAPMLIKPVATFLFTPQFAHILVSEQMSAIPQCTTIRRNTTNANDSACVIAHTFNRQARKRFPAKH